MQFLFLSAGLLSFATLPTAAPTGSETTAPQDSEDAAFDRITYLKALSDNAMFNRVSEGACTAGVTWRRRLEWTDLEDTDKEAFITAIHCLNTLPSELPLNRAPGARTRYDDFIVTHIEQTPFVHASGLFLPFHRYLVHLFEQDLRSKCGYDGPFPFWDWSRSWRDPGAHAVFDGSEMSLGGNGAYVEGREATSISLPGGVVVEIPPATGGGCVESGPFAEGRYEVRLGPVGYEPKGPQGGLGYNPRCLTRDISPEFAKRTRPSRVVALLDGCLGLGCVVEKLDVGDDGVPGGVHAAGHWQVGLNALDVYASPSDPIFWLHHAQVDRIWTVWQGLAPERRIEEVWGTGTAANIPPSANVTLDTMVDFGILSPPKPLRDLVSPIGGDMCYLYKW